MFQVQLSFVVNLSNVFPVQFPNFPLSFSFLFQWLQLLPVQSYSSGSTFAASLYINSCILTSFSLLFAQHFCLPVLPHLSVCMFSLSVCTYYYYYYYMKDIDGVCYQSQDPLGAEQVFQPTRRSSRTGLLIRRFRIQF